MYSDESPRNNGWSRCLFCSLQCTLGIRDAGGGFLEAVFPPSGGLCARGTCVGELVAMVRRGTARDGRTGRDLPLEEGLRQAGAALREAAGIDIIVDGNHRAEVLALTAATVAAFPERVRGFVSLPGEDLLLLQHAWASGARTNGIGALEGIDGLLIIGDPFSSHPRSATPILEFKRRNRRAPVVVIDSSPRRTAPFASHPVIVEPHAVPAAVACAVPEGAAAFPRQTPDEIDPTGTLRRALNALSKCSRPGVIVASSPGRGCQWPSAAYFAGLVARVHGAPLGVLTQYGNARCAARFIVANAMQPVGSLAGQAPDGRALIVLGEEELCLPTGEIADYAAGASAVIHGGLQPMNGSTLYFPGTVFAEDSGTVLSADEQWEEIPAAIAPPVGMLGTTQLLRALLEAGGCSVEYARISLPEHPELVTPPPVQLSRVGGAGPLRGMLTADPEQFVNGQLTGLTRLGAREPVAVVAAADCARAGIVDGAAVTVSSEFGSCVAVARACPYQPAGFATVSCTNGNVKGLFTWELCGGLRVASPARVAVEPFGHAE